MTRKLIITIDDTKKSAQVGPYNMAAIWGDCYRTGVQPENFPSLPSGPITMRREDARVFVAHAANLSEAEANEQIQLDGVTSIWISNGIFVGLKGESNV